jgi:hypothetical protein
MIELYGRIKDVTADDVTRFAERYLTERNRTVAYRVKEEEEAAAGAEEEIDEEKLRAYIMSLPADQQMEIMQTFQKMRSEAEAMKYAKELWERAKAEGFIER